MNKRFDHEGSIEFRAREIAPEAKRDGLQLARQHGNGCSRAHPDIAVKAMIGVLGIELHIEPDVGPARHILVGRRDTKDRHIAGCEWELLSYDAGITSEGAL